MLPVSTANPYESFLGGRDAQAVIAETPRKLAALVQRLGTGGLERSLGPGKWPARSILCHLADCEVVFAFRLRQALAEPHHVIQPFDQDAWSVQYSGMDAQAALETFSTVRRWNQALIASLKPGDFSRGLAHPERGEMTLQVVVETMGGHDLNHLRQLETIAAQ